MLTLELSRARGGKASLSGPGQFQVPICEPDSGQVPFSSQPWSVGLVYPQQYGTLAPCW